MPVLTARALIRSFVLAAVPLLFSCGGGDGSSAAAVSAIQNTNLPQAQPDDGAENNAATVATSAGTLL